MSTLIEFAQHGVMLPDYFSGTSGVQISVPVDKKTTVDSVLEEIEAECNDLFDLIEGTAEANDYETTDLSADIDGVIAGIKEFVRKQGNGNQPFAPTLELDFDDLEMDMDIEGNDLPVAIFSLEFVD